MSHMQTSMQAWLMRYRQPVMDAVWSKDEQPMAREPLNALLSDIEVVTPHIDLTEESCEATRDGARELQLR